MANILIAEDEQEFADLVCDYLRNAGHTVRTAGDGVRVTAAVSQQPPEVIVLDLQMPAGRGTDVLQRLQANPAWAGIPVVILSCLSEREARGIGYTGGAAAYLTKPVPMRQLLEVIESALDYSAIAIIPD